MGTVSDLAAKRLLDHAFGAQSFMVSKTNPEPLLRMFGMAIWDALTPLTGEPRFVISWPDWSTSSVGWRP